MTPVLDVRAALAAELKRLVRDSGEWPMRDRRRFRNLLLDAATSDAMPLAELLLRVADDGMLRGLPERSAGRSEWEAAAGRLAGDLQLRRFVEPGIARFVADAWTTALGLDPVPSARVAAPRPVVARRQPVRPPAVASARPAVPITASNAASIRAYRRANMLIVAVGLVFTVLVVLAFRATNRRSSVAPRTTTQMPEPAPLLPLPQPSVSSTVRDPNDDSIARARSRAVPPLRQPVAIAVAPTRTSDDIVLNAGRVFEGRVLSVRQQSVVVKDAETGLDFEIDKADIDRIVTSDGRVMRFGSDNVPVIGDNDDLTPRSNAGTYRLRYTERWGAERTECRDMARRFAPGSTLIVRHLRGAPMMKLEFVDGPGFNTAVRSDGLFESGAAQALQRGPSEAIVSRRLSGRLSRSGVLQGVARLTAMTADGSVVCDVALTVRGERVP